MGPRTPLPRNLSVATSFSVAQARDAGVTAKRLRGSDLSRPFHAVRVLASEEPLTLEARCQAYARRMRDCEIFTHRTAALLHGLPVATRADARLDVGAWTPAGLPRSEGVRGHRLDADLVRVTVRGGLRVVTALDAWCQLAAELTIRELIVVGDGLVRRRHPLATAGALDAAVRAHAGHRGHRMLVAAFRLIRPGTDSPAETELRLDLVEFGLPEPEVNGRILDAGGRLIAIGDLVYRRYRVIVEYDGDQHRRDPGQYARDIDRLDDLARAGWRVVRFNRSHRGIRRRQRLERVREALLSAGWTPTTPTK